MLPYTWVFRYAKCIARLRVKRFMGRHKEKDAIKQKVAMLRDGEYVPKQDRIYRKSFIRIARTLSAAGINSNAAFARHFGVHESTVARWRKQDPAFDSAILNGAEEFIVECTQIVQDAIRNGDSRLAFDALKVRGEAWKPKTSLDHTSNGETLSALLAQHGAMSDKEAIDKGLIIDETEESEPPRRSREYDED